ncbi:uncharacterized mitochondrial protein AtMg00810-like [Lathyrus oleraceus]|uniref:uncharacterized mitochondrial protein AtMg00810-like n=1 Tax=Pisum sativum TaxID=3888 RepID=UPI0021CE837C|nr:uncharacterized mitochondrial protein AtMg00810-like [Pisum sativum]
MGELTYFLGLQIKQLKEGMYVCQIKYCQELLKRFGMEDAKSIDTLMPTNGNLDKDESGKDFDVEIYKGFIGYILYLTASMSGIMFSVYMCAPYQYAHKESHLKSIKHILRYLHGTSKYELWFSKVRNYSLVGYSDFDFASCKSERKSTNGTCHMFSNSLVSWHDKKQVSIALSTAEAEYVTTGSCCAQILLLK